MKFLITDDSIFMRNLLVDIIEKLGHEVVGQAANGQEAEEMYFNLNPDIVTMDITMPEVDGIEGARSIMAKDPKAKIVIVSAMGQKDLILEAVKLGVADFIVKPFQADRLKDTLDKLEREIKNIVD